MGLSPLAETSKPVYVYVPTTSHLYSLDSVSNLAVAIVAFALDFLFLRKDPVQAGIVALTYLGGLYSWGSFKEFREKSSALDLQIAEQEAICKRLQAGVDQARDRVKATELQIALVQHEMEELPAKKALFKEMLESNYRMIEADVKTSGYRVVGTVGRDGRITFTKTKVNRQAAQSLPKPNAPGDMTTRKTVQILMGQSRGTGQNPI